MKGYTIQHSIDLLEDSVEDLEARPSGGGTAADVSYDNTSSHLTADDVQEAIDELNTAISQIDTGDNYSETETVIGSWIDGSPLYRRTFTGLSVVTNTDTWVKLGLNISDLNRVIKVDAYRVSADNPTKMALAESQVQDGDVAVTVVSSTYNGTIIIATVEYTKTPAQSTRSKKTKKEE